MKTEARTLDGDSGSLLKRFAELIRRVDQGTWNIKWVIRALQQVIDGTAEVKVGDRLLPPFGKTLSLYVVDYKMFPSAELINSMGVNSRWVDQLWGDFPDIEWNFRIPEANLEIPLVAPQMKHLITDPEAQVFGCLVNLLELNGIKILPVEIGIRLLLNPCVLNSLRPHKCLVPVRVGRKILFWKIEFPDDYELPEMELKHIPMETKVDPSTLIIGKTFAF